MAIKLPDSSLDTEKKKYFKVQSTGSAPASSAYSSEDIKKRNARERELIAAQLERHRQRGRIHRSDALINPLSRGLIQRETGNSVGIDGAQIYANGLVPQGGLRFLSDGWAYDSPEFDVEPREDLGGSIADIRISKFKYSAISSLSSILSLSYQVLTDRQ